MAKDSLVVFDRYQPRGQCAVAVIAACSIVERFVGKLLAPTYSPTFPDWDSVIAAASKLGGIVTASGHRQPAFRYLQRPDLGGLMMRDGGQGPFEPVSELLTELLKPYFQPDRPLGGLDQHGSKLSSEAIELLRRVKEAAQSKHWYKKQLVEIENAGRKLGPFTEFLERLGGGSTVPHPDFPGLPILSDLAIASEFHHLAPLKSARQVRRGLFVVLREARGWTVDANDTDKTNTIVRDLLWIEDMGQVVQGRSAIPGLYFSAYDKKAIEVSAKGDYEDALKLKNILVTAKQVEDEEANQRFQLFFPVRKAPGSIEIRDAIIAGTGRDAMQLGAWKSLLTEPGWSEAERLETLIHVLRDRAYSHAVLEKCLLEGGYCGVLYHDGMQGAFSIRDSFRRLLVGGHQQTDAVRDFGGFLKDQIREVLSRTIASTSSLAPPYVALEKALSDLNALLRDRWHLVEPAQIITFISDTAEHRGFSANECRRLLEPLLAILNKPQQREP